MKGWWRRWHPTLDLVLTLFIILVAWSAVTDPFEWRTPFVVGAGLYVWWRVLNLGIDLEKARNKVTHE